MKKAIILIAMVAGLVTSASAGYVSGYTKSNGTYVQGHYRSDPNDTVRDNYSYDGNINPYSGKRGTRTYGGY